MRLLYIFSQFSVKGGTERIFISKMNYLADVLGYEVHSLGMYQKDDQPNAYPTSDKIIQHRFGFDYLSIDLLRPWRYFLDRRKVIKRLQEKIDEVRPDYVMVSTATTRNIVDINLPEGTKLIMESHCARNMMWVECPWFVRLRRYHLLAHEEKIAHKIVCLTRTDAKMWKGDNIIIIPNFVEVAVDEEKVREQRLTVARTSKKIVSLGRHYPQKGYDMLISAWAKVHAAHPDWQLQIGGYDVGSGVEEKLRRQIKDMGLSDTITLGPRIDDVPAFFSDVSFFVLSSRYEGFGLVLLEAMTCGLPCVSFDCPTGPSDIISHKKDGLLVENGSIDKLAESMCYMIEHEDERMQMSLNALEKVKQFDRETIMHQWQSLFEGA